MAHADPAKETEQSASGILFVDVCDSVDLFERLGERSAGAIIRARLETMTAQIGQHGGRVLKELGDGLLAFFPRATELVTAAAAIHRSVQVANDAVGPEERLRIHSGGHSGTVHFNDGGDVFGNVVNVAARVLGIARADEIFLTEDVLRNLRDPGQLLFRPVGLFPVRGKREEIEIYELLWQRDQTITVMADREGEPQSALVLWNQGRETKISGDNATLTMGRGPGNDVVVDESVVSREHARIVRRKDRFYLIDHSTNGTFVRPGSGRIVRIHRDEIFLDGSGEFHLGSIEGRPLRYEAI